MPEYNKLVRGLVPDVITADGKRAVTRILSLEEYTDALLSKLCEEARELADAAPSSRLSELADVTEVLEALKQAIGVTEQEVQSERLSKVQQRGGFSRRIFLERVDDATA